MHTTEICADVRSMDPVSYITAIGLQPEDAYGFLPLEHSDGSALAFVYRDRPSYADARAGLAAPQRSRRLGGMVEVDRPQAVSIDIGAVAPAGPTAPIASHRVYPGLNKRSSGKQLNHFLPRYVETVGVRGEDVFGVFARGIHFSGGDSSAREWDSLWLVYRDRPEYASGRERWASEMAKPGRWPAAEITPGSETPPSLAGSAGRVEVRREGWPKRRLMMRETGEGLGARLVEEIAKLGHTPESSFGLCPDFQQRKIFYAWERRS